MTNNDRQQNAMEQYRDSVLASLEWDFKRKGGYAKTRINADISISQQKNGRTSGAITFIFRNNTWESISPNETSIATCISKNRIFFIPNDNGYRLTNQKGKGSNRYLKMCFLEKYVPFVGNYSLKYDEFLGLYYIEKEG